MGRKLPLFNDIKMKKNCLKNKKKKRRSGANTSKQDKYFHFIKQQMSLSGFCRIFFYWYYFSCEQKYNNKKKLHESEIYTLSIRFHFRDWPWKSNHMASASLLSQFTIVPSFFSFFFLVPISCYFQPRIWSYSENWPFSERDQM